MLMDIWAVANNFSDYKQIYVQGFVPTNVNSSGLYINVSLGHTVILCLTC